LIQPVDNPGKWPGFQRYDYLLRTRKATQKELTLFKGIEKAGKLMDPYPQKDAVLFALREITKMDRGTTYDDWRTLPQLENPIPKR
jgi:hypothetical protein